MVAVSLHQSVPCTLLDQEATTVNGSEDVERVTLFKKKQKKTTTDQVGGRGSHYQASNF